MRRCADEPGAAALAGPWRACAAAVLAGLLLVLSPPPAAAVAAAATVAANATASTSATTPTIAPAATSPTVAADASVAADAADAPGKLPSLDEAQALRAAEAAIGRSIPQFTLLDRQGRPVALAAYRGKPLLVSFIYTGCFQVCPTQTRALDEAVRGLERMLGEGQFNVVSVGFNQPFDSPVAMRAFAAQQRIGYRNWEFLSPTPAQVDELTRAFGFSYVATPAGFDHLLGVSVVDAHGRIHAQVYGDRLRADQLGVPLRQLLLAGPAPSASTLERVVERVRILCTVYDPDTGEYRYDYKLIFEIIGGALFFASVAVYFLLEWRDQRRARRRAGAARGAAGRVAA